MKTACPVQRAPLAARFRRSTAVQRASVRARITCQPRHVLDVSASAQDSASEFAEEQGGFSAELTVPTRGMAGMGSFSGATLQKQNLDLTQKQQTMQPRTDDSGGGGDNGKSINNGGGGDGDDGDDDDYFDEGDDDGDGDDDGIFTTRNVIPELFDKATIEAVMAEWFRTLADLPAGIRMAVEMGLVSSAQLWRFFTLDCKPTIVRTVARVTPPAFSRAFVGRLMADPFILYKMAMEQVLTIGGSVAYEMRMRGDNFKSEWGQVVANTTTLCAANAAMVWSLAPTRSFGNAHKYAWQRALHSLPNHVFDQSGPLREYTHVSRVAGLLWKGAELSAIGVIAGTAQNVMTNTLVNIRRKKEPGYTPSLPVPSAAQSAAGLGAWLGISCNARYQALSGLDRWLSVPGERTFWGSLGLVLGSTAVMRYFNQRVGEPMRLSWQGLPSAPYKREKKVPKKAVRKTRVVIVEPEEVAEDTLFTMSAKDMRRQRSGPSRPTPSRSRPQQRRQPAYQ